MRCGYRFRVNVGIPARILSIRAGCQRTATDEGGGVFLSFQTLTLFRRWCADSSELLKSARGRTRTGTAKAKGFSYQLQLSLLRQFLKTHLWSGLSLYRIAEQHYEVGRSRQVSTLSLALARYEATISMLLPPDSDLSNKRRAKA